MKPNANTDTADIPNEELGRVFLLKHALYSVEPYICSIKNLLQYVIDKTNKNNGEQKPSKSLSDLFMRYTPNYHMVNEIKRLENFRYYACKIVVEPKEIKQEVWELKSNVNDVNNYIFQLMESDLDYKIAEIKKKQTHLKKQKQDKINLLAKEKNKLHDTAAKIRVAENNSQVPYNKLASFRTNRQQLHKNITDFEKSIESIQLDQKCVAIELKWLNTLSIKITENIKSCFTKFMNDIGNNNYDKKQLHAYYLLTKNSIKGQLITLGKKNLNKWLENQNRIIDIRQCFEKGSTNHYLEMDKIEPICLMFSTNGADYLSVNDIIMPNKSPSVLLGPAGSGKTCLFYFILCNFLKQSGRLYNLCYFDIVLYLRNEDVKKRSFCQQIKEELHNSQSKGIAENNNVLESLNKINALFLVEINNTFVDEDKDALDELLKSQDKNKIIISSRLENSHTLCGMLDSINQRYDAVYFQHLKGARLEYAIDQLVVKKESTFIGSKKLSKYFSENITLLSLFYPLYLIYILHLWKINSKKINKNLTVFTLLYEIYLTCEQDFNQKVAVDTLPHGQKLIIDKTLQQFIKDLANNFLLQKLGGNKKYFESAFETINLNFLLSQVFYPFIMLELNERRIRVVHSIIIEFLVGIGIAKKFEGYDLLSFRNLFVFVHLEENFKKCIYSSRNIVSFCVAKLCYSNKMNRILAAKFINVLNNSTSFLNCNVWGELLFNTNNNDAVVKTVKYKCDQFTDISIDKLSFYETESIALFLKSGGLNCKSFQVKCTEPNIKSVLSALSEDANKDIDVVCRGERRQVDFVLQQLKSSGNITYLQGTLKNEGVSLIKNMKRIQHVDINIESFEAFVAFSEILKCNLNKLKHIALRINIEEYIEAKRFPFLKIGNARFEVRLPNIADERLGWVGTFINTICDKNKCKRVVLSDLRTPIKNIKKIKALESALSPIKLEITGPYYKHVPPVFF